MPSMTHTKWFRPLVVIILAILLIYLLFSRGCLGGSKLVSVVPDSHLLLIEMRDVDKQMEELKNTDWWSDMDQVEWVARLPELLDLMDAAFSEGEDHSLTKGKDLLASLHLTNASDYDYLGVMRGMGSPGSLVARAKERGLQSTSHTYHGISIYSITGLDRSLHIASVGGNLVFSVYPTLLEEAISTQRTGNPDAQRASKLFARFNKKNLHIYVHSGSASYFETAFLKKGQNSFFDLLSMGAGGFAFEMRPENGQLNFDIIGDALTKNSQLDVIRKIESSGLPKKPSRVAEVVPHNAAFFLHQQVQNGEEFLGSLTSDGTFKESYAPWVGDHWGLIFSEQSNAREQVPACFVITCKDAQEAEKFVSRMSAKQMGRDSFIDYRGTDLMPLPDPWIIKAIYGEWIASIFQGNYAAIIDGHVVIANDQRPLEQLINHKKSAQTLSEELKYQELAHKLGHQNQHVYTQARYLRQTFRDHASESMQTWLDENGYLLDKVISAGIYPSRKNKVNKLKLAANFGTSRRAPSSVVWNTVLEAPAIQAPQIVEGLNGQPYLFVQDENNKLYLLSKAGKINWSKKLDGPILGKIRPLDYYQTGKLNFIFNTREKIHVLDKEGENLSNFPIRLSSEATAGMVMVDMDDNKVEKLFIPCVNEKSYGYRYSGQPLSGWNPKDGLGQISQPLKYFRQKDQEFIIALNETGVIYLLDRYGDIIHLADLQSKPLGSPEFDQRKGLAVIMVTTEDGKTHVINQNGEFWSKNYVEKEQLNDFITGNYAGDKKKELVFSGKENISIHSVDSKLLSTKNYCRDTELFNASLKNSPVSSLGCLCLSLKKIFIFDARLNVLDGFPIEASTLPVVYDLFGSQEAILIAGGDQRNVFAYRLP